MFSENTKQYDETLKRVLERRDSKNTTLNLEKSVFCKNNLKYYGFKFSEKDMVPDPEKGKRNKRNTSSRKKVLQIFLGLTNYMKRFIDDYTHERSY